MFLFCFSEADTLTHCSEWNPVAEDVAIETMDYAYFGNDYNDTFEFDDDKKFLRIAVI